MKMFVFFAVFFVFLSACHNDKSSHNNTPLTDLDNIDWEEEVFEDNDALQKDENRDIETSEEDLDDKNTSDIDVTDEDIEDKDISDIDATDEDIEDKDISDIDVTDILKDYNKNYFLSDTIFMWVVTNGSEVFVGSVMGNIYRVEDNGVLSFIEELLWLPYSSFIWTGDPAVDASGNIWVASIFGLIKYDGVSWQFFSTNDMDVPSDDSGLLCQPAAVHENTVWANVYSEGIVYFDGFMWHYYKHEETKIPLSSFVTIKPDPFKNNKAWLFASFASEEEGGLWILDNDKVAGFTTSNSKLHDNFIRDVVFYNNKTYILFNDFTIQLFSESEKDFIDFASGYMSDNDYAAKFFFSANNEIYVVGTKNLYFFNGSSWTAQNIINYSRTVNLFDEEGYFWVFGEIKIYRFKNGKLINEYDRDTMEVFRGNRENKALSALVCNNKIYSITNKGVNVFENEEWRLSDAPNNIFHSDILRIKAVDNNIWFAGEIHGVSMYDGVSWKIYDAFDGLISSANDSAEIRDIAVDKSGVVWAVGDVYGIFRKTGEKWEALGNIYNRESSVVFSDSLNRVWFGDGEGVLMYDQQEWHKYSYRTGDLVEFITTIEEATDGTLYFGNRFGKIYQFKDNKWSLLLEIPEQQSSKLFSEIAFESEINRIAFDKDGVLWIGSEKGIYTYQKDILKKFDIPLTKFQVTDIAVAPDNKVWFVTDDYLGYIEKDTWYLQQLPDSQQVVGIQPRANTAGIIVPKSIAIDNDGNIYIGNDAGIVLLTKKN